MEKDLTKIQLQKEIAEIQKKYDSLKILYEQELKNKQKENLLLEKLISASDEFIQYRFDTPDYDKILKLIIEISGAKYGSFNIFDDNGKDFTTVSVSGISEDIKKAISYVGYEIKHNRWKYDPYREKISKNQNITRFESLHELTRNVISKTTIFLLEKTFGLGEVFLVKILKENKVLGDFTLMFRKGETLVNQIFVDLYAHQVGMFLDRFKITDTLRTSEENLSLAQSIAKVGYWEYNNISLAFEWSSEMYEIFGLTTEEFHGNPESVIKVIHPEDSSIFLNSMSNESKGSNSTSFKYRVIKKDGSIHHLYAVSYVKNQATGMPTKIIGTVQDISERIEADELLRQNRLNYETFFNAIDEFLFVLDEQGNIIHVNSTVIDRLGYSKEELIGKSVLFVHPPDRRDEAGKIVFEMLQGKADYCPVPILTKAGDQIPVETKVTGGFWNGKAVIFGVTKDISKLKLSEEKFSKLFYLNPSAAGLSDLTNGKYIEVNDSFKTLLGFDKNEVIGKTAIELGIISIEDIKQTLLLADNEGKIINAEANLNTKSGEIKHVLLSAENIYIQDKKYRITVVNDISERKQAEERISESERKFRLIAENTSDGILIFDSTNTIQYVSPSYIKQLGYSETEELNRTPDTIYQVIYPDDRDEVFSSIYKAIEFKKDELTYSYRVRNKSGNYFWREDHANFHYDNNGNYLGAYIICRDISQRKYFEQEIIRAKEHAEESDRLKTAFLANMSHEIRTPMNGILGFTELLKEPKLTGENQQKFINLIEKSGIRMLNIVNDIISISKVEAGQMDVSISETIINEQIEFIYNFFKPEVEQKGLQIIFSTPLTIDESLIRTDREKVFAILTNLVKNAIKFTSKGLIEIGYKKKDNMLEFYVKDTGIGIRNDLKEIIFERFRQGSEALNRNYEGAGLGLSIAKAYVEMLGGTIRVESTEGKGSEFYFTLPYNNSQHLPKGKKVHVNSNSKNNHIKDLKILIAEDDETSEILISMTVELMAGEIFRAKTGIEVIEICLKNKDIDLILMDIKMPEMDGYDATRKIREFNKDVIIIAQTAFALTGDREKAIEAGCNDYISKPFNTEFLSELIQKYFKQ